MAGYQFFHIEGYSRSGGKGGRSVGYVLDEAERRPGACPHVDQPGAPTVLHGMSIGDLRAVHDQRAGEARQSVAGGKTRAIRQDQLTLLTAVASYPVPWSDLDDAGRIEVEAWERRTIDWLKGQYGDRLATVVRHSDERHPHLHAYVLPDDPAMRAGLLHPGFQAKAAVMDREKPADAEERKALNKEGDRAYREAMRGLQSSYWQDVGLPSGLARLGPGRRRLTREAWQSEKTAAASVVVATRQYESALGAARSLQERGNAFVARTHAAAAETRQEASRRLQEAKRREAEVEGLKAEAIRRGRESILAARRKAAEIVQSAEAAAAPLRTIGGAIGTAWSAVRDRLSDQQTRHEAEMERVRKEGERETERQRERTAEERQKTVAERNKGDAVRASLAEKSASLERSRSENEALERRVQILRHSLDQAQGRKPDAPGLKSPGPRGPRL